MATIMDRNQRGQFGVGSTVGTRRLSKRNLSTSALASLNTSSSSTLGVPVRPSPASSTSDGFSFSSGDPMRSYSALPQRIEPLRQNSGPSSSEDERKKDSSFGLKKKMSRTGTMLSKRASIRTGTGAPARSQSEVSLAQHLQENDRVADEIREKAAKDTARAMNPMVEPSIHPVRRRSLFTPGLATRNLNDPLRKQSYMEDRRRAQPIEQPPASAPLFRPPPSASASYLQPQVSVFEANLPLTPPPRFNALGTIGGEDPLSRASTPSECDYGRLGNGLRIVNGMASPDPSIGRPSPQIGHRKSLTTAYGGYMDHRSGGQEHFAPYDETEDYFSPAKPALVKAPLIKSRLYSISNVERADDQIKSTILTAPTPRAPRHSPSNSQASDSSQLAQEYMVDLKSSPFDEPDLNKPLPIPPPPSTGNTPVIPQEESLAADPFRMARVNSDRTDLDYRRRESIKGDLPSWQDSLMDETLSLLDSIGSGLSDLSRPRITTTTSTSTIYSSSTVPTAAPFKQISSHPQVSTTLSNKSGSTVVTSTTGPTTLVTRTKVSSPNNARAHATPVQTSHHTSTTISTTQSTNNWSRHETSQYSHPPAVSAGAVRAVLVRNDDSGYNSSLSQTSVQGTTSQTRGHRRAASNLEPSSHRPPLQVRPPLSQSSSATQNDSEVSSAFSDSSDGTTPTLASLREAVTGPKGPRKKRAKKSTRPTSMPPPVERISVQGEKLNYSGFIPPVPQDMASRHIQRGMDFPPLAETVSPVHPGSQEPEVLSSKSPQAFTFPSPAQPKASRRSSKGFFSGRFLKIGSSTNKAPEPEIVTAPCQLSKAERRASRSEPPRQNSKGDEVLTDLNEVAEFYGSSPYDAATPLTARRRSSQGGWETVHPALRPVPYLGETIDERMVSAPLTAPPSQQNFGDYDNRAGYHPSSHEQYHNTQQAQPTVRKATGLRQRGASGRRPSEQLLSPNPRDQSHEYSHRRHVSENSSYTASAPVTPGEREGSHHHSGYHSYSRSYGGQLVAT